MLAYYPAWDRILVFQDRAEVVDVFFSLSESRSTHLQGAYVILYFTEFTKYDIQRCPL